MPLFPDPKILEMTLSDKKYLPHVFLNKADDWFISAQFLINYKYAYETYKSYRRDIERFLLWVWLFQDATLASVTVSHLQSYIDFVRSVPDEWVMTHHVRRYLDVDEVICNPLWRPFIRHNETDSVNIKSLLAILSTYFNYLVDHDCLAKNPVKLLKQKKHLLKHMNGTRVVRKLSASQWSHVIAQCSQLKDSDPAAMRNWWMLGLFYLLGLRISEVAVTDRHEPTMGDFWKDDQGFWWFKVVGKGNKLREIAVPMSLMEMLAQYRKSLGLCEYMGVREKTPLLPKFKGVGGLGVRQVRLCVEQCFKQASYHLRQLGQEEDALHLDQATVHWLRHTSISNAVKFRPIEHVRDDAGHSSITITDIYIDSDRNERNRSAQYKKLNDVKTSDDTLDGW